MRLIRWQEKGWIKTQIVSETKRSWFGLKLNIWLIFERFETIELRILTALRSKNFKKFKISIRQSRFSDLVHRCPRPTITEWSQNFYVTLNDHVSFFAPTGEFWPKKFGDFGYLPQVSLRRKLGADRLIAGTPQKDDLEMIKE